MRSTLDVADQVSSESLDAEIDFSQLDLVTVADHEPTPPHIDCGDGACRVKSCPCTQYVHPGGVAICLTCGHGRDLHW